MKRAKKWKTLFECFRIIEYVGPRSAVENQLSKSLGDGTRVFGINHSVAIRIATIGGYPEILETAKEEKPDKSAREKYIITEEGL